MDENDKVWKKLLRESWLSISLLVISALFTSGVTYAHVNADIVQTKLDLSVVQRDLGEIKTDFIQQRHEDRMEINQRLDTIENKIDEINRYLRTRVK